MYATIGLARLMRQAQPRLWDYALQLRDKRFAARLLDTTAMLPVLHVSQRYPASRLCAAPVLPLAGIRASTTAWWCSTWTATRRRCCRCRPTTSPIGSTHPRPTCPKASNAFR